MMIGDGVTVTSVVYNMDVDMWLSLPPDLLLEIFRRLEATAVVHCAAACKPWRRAIIGNAVCLRPRHDGFVPSLLLGFLYSNLEGKVRLRPLESLLAVQPFVAAAADDDDSTRCCDGEAASFCVPLAAAAAGGGGVDLDVYNQVLSSRDGLLLLGGNAADDLCLWNTMPGGGCTFLPAAAFEDCRYLLVTPYDLPTSDADDATATRIVAVEHGGRINTVFSRSLTYQLFSGAGEWGPIERSPEHIFTCTGVICRGAVHWLGKFEVQGGARNNCTFAVDVRAGRSRTWMTELPEKLRYTGTNLVPKMVLATSRDGHLSVVSFQPPPCHRIIEAWVLAGGERWTLRWTVDIQDLPGCCPSYWSASVDSFCPRSGYVMGKMYGRMTVTRVDAGGVMHCVMEKGRLLIDVDSGTARVMNMCTKHGANHPYEMDLSTYISKMKHF
ncbi:hypothetical protein ACP4OV_002353 [Aristida adscensionis]